MIISKRSTLSFALQEKLLVKLMRQNHAPTKITIADNQHKLDSRNSLAWVQPY